MNTKASTNCLYDKHPNTSLCASLYA